MRRIILHLIAFALCFQAATLQLQAEEGFEQRAAILTTLRLLSREFRHVGTANAFYRDMSYADAAVLAAELGEHDLAEELISKVQASGGFISEHTVAVIFDIELRATSKERAWKFLIAHTSKQDQRNQRDEIISRVLSQPWVVNRPEILQYGQTLIVDSHWKSMAELSILRNRILIGDQTARMAARTAIRRYSPDKDSPPDELDVVATLAALLNDQDVILKIIAAIHNEDKFADFQFELAAKVLANLGQFSCARQLINEIKDDSNQHWATEHLVQAIVAKNPADADQILLELSQQDFITNSTNDEIAKTLFRSGRYKLGHIYLKRNADSIEDATSLRTELTKHDSLMLTGKRSSALACLLDIESRARTLAADTRPIDRVELQLSLAIANSRHDQRDAALAWYRSAADLVGRYQVKGSFDLDWGFLGRFGVRILLAEAAYDLNDPILFRDAWGHLMEGLRSQNSWLADAQIVGRRLWN